MPRGRASTYVTSVFTFAPIYIDKCVNNLRTAKEALFNFLSGAVIGPSLAALPKICPVSVLSPL
jgi:hypothetical protein